MFKEGAIQQFSLTNCGGAEKHITYKVICFCGPLISFTRCKEEPKRP